MVVSLQKLEIVNIYTDRQSNRCTQNRTKNLKTNAVVNAGPSDTEYLYYPLDVEGVSLKGSLLPAWFIVHRVTNIIIIITIRI